MMQAIPSRAMTLTITVALPTLGGRWTVGRGAA
jgi:hypothetical protein